MSFVKKDVTSPNESVANALAVSATSNVTQEKSSTPKLKSIPVKL